VGGKAAKQKGVPKLGIFTSSNGGDGVEHRLQKTQGLAGENRRRWRQGMKKEDQWKKGNGTKKGSEMCAGDIAKSKNRGGVQERNRGRRSCNGKKRGNHKGPSNLTKGGDTKTKRKGPTINRQTGKLGGDRQTWPGKNSYV